ncbi:MAG: hypothetical protein SGPRY_012722 [Prymnesium sp.]
MSDDPPLASYLEALRAQLVFASTDNEKREKIVGWTRGDMTLRMATDTLALATIDELSSLLKLFEGALPPRKKTNPASWAAKLLDGDRATGRRGIIECTLCGLKNVNHFCQNEMVPILSVNMALRLCIECAQKETPGICAALDAQVDELLEDNNVKRKFRTLASGKEKYFLSLCRHDADDLILNCMGEEGEEGVRAAHHCAGSSANDAARDPGSVDPESLQLITESEMVQLTDDFLQGKWNPHNVASPINSKYVMRERLPALTFAERKTIVAQREVLDWKVRSLACSVVLYLPHFSPVQHATVIGKSSTQR